jgi:hypothetical protein
VPLVTAIPSMGMSPLLADVVRVARQESLAVRVYDNTPEDEDSQIPIIPGVTVVRLPGHTIYSEWNNAAQWAYDLNVNLALLNDDLYLPSGVLTTLSEALDDNPMYALISVDWDERPIAEPHVVRARGTFREHGIAGWAFVVRSDRWPGVDPLYRVWYGDDDLVAKLLSAGWEVGRYRGVFVAHETSTTIHNLPWTQDAIIEDVVRWSRRGND